MHRNVLLLKLCPELGDVVRHDLPVTLCKQMKQGHPGLETPGQLADKHQPAFPAADRLPERHQDVAGVRLGQGYDPHDGQVNRDRPQEAVNDMPLLVGPVALIGSQGIKYEIGLFRLYPFGQHGADLADLRNPGHGDAQFRSECIKMILMAGGMMQHRVICSFFMGRVQHKPGLALHGH